MATITKRPGRRGGYTYRVQIRRRGHPPLNKSFDRRKDAESWAREHDREVKLAGAFTDTKGRNKTLADMIDRYMEEYAGRDYTRVSRLAWWKGHLGHMRLPNVTSDLIADSLDTLRTGVSDKEIRGAGKGRTQRSESTVNRYHAALSAVYRFAIKRRWRWVSGNPCRDIERGPESRGRTRYLSDDERVRLLDACRASEWTGLYPLVLLALSTGARRGELLNLRWSDIDIATGLARLLDTKNGAPRMLPLVKPVREILFEYAKVRRIDSELLFPSRTNPNKPPRIYDYWWPALRVAGVPDFRFHDLRHSCASYLAMNGASAVEIADVLGHKTLAMVQRYSHLATEHKAALLERVTGTMLS